MKLDRERRVDWARVVENLQRVGEMSMQDIADDIGVAKSTLYGYVSEDLPAEPSFWAGWRLVALWCSTTGFQMDAVPTRRVGMSVSAVLRASR